MDKDLIKKAESISRPDSIEKAADLTHYVMGLVPGLGNVLAGIFSGIASGRRFERIKEVVTLLALEVRAVDQKASEYISTEDFEDIFYQTLVRVSQERREEKRRIYKTFLKAAIINQLGYDDFKQQRILSLLDELHPLDIAILKAILEEPKPQEERGLVSGSPIGTLKLRTRGLNDEQIQELVTNLNRLGITNLQNIETLMTIHGARDLRHNVTRMGLELCKYIIE